MTASDRKKLLATFIAACIYWLEIAAASKSFPLTIGGFDLNTGINGMLLMPLHKKLFIAFMTDDPAFVDTVANPLGYCYTLFDYQNTKEYLWSK